MRNVPACCAIRICWDLNPWLIGHLRNIQWCHLARRFNQPAKHFTSRIATRPFMFRVFLGDFRWGCPLGLCRFSMLWSRETTTIYAKTLILSIIFLEQSPWRPMWPVLGCWWPGARKHHAGDPWKRLRNSNSLMPK